VKRTVGSFAGIYTAMYHTPTDTLQIIDVRASDRETIYKAQKGQPAEINRLSEAEKTYWTGIAEAKNTAKNRSQMER